jgi:hypothetical protein
MFVRCLDWSFGMSFRQGYQKMLHHRGNAVWMRTLRTLLIGNSHAADHAATTELKFGIDAEISIGSIADTPSKWRPVDPTVPEPIDRAALWYWGDVLWSEEGPAEPAPPQQRLILPKRPGGGEISLNTPVRRAVFLAGLLGAVFIALLFTFLARM